MAVHVHGGSVLLERLVAAGVPGERIEWAEVLCEGPTPAGVDGSDWYTLRGAWLHDAFGGGGNVRTRLVGQDLALEAALRSDEIALWCGPELFCQAILVRLAAWMDGRGARVSLVGPGDVDGHPGCSVGQLGEAALRAAFAARRWLDDEALGLARRVWEAWRAPVPVALAALAETSLVPFEHLGAAVRRHLEELPDVRDGLSRAERAVLSAVADGAGDVREAFPLSARGEQRPWLTDQLFVMIARRLADGRTPLLVVDGADGAATGAAGVTDVRLALTAHGADVLIGRAAWTGADVRWVGGVRVDQACPWRWDAVQRQIVRV